MTGHCAESRKRAADRRKHSCGPKAGTVRQWSAGSSDGERHRRCDPLGGTDQGGD